MKKGSESDGLVFHAGFPNAAEDSLGQLSLDRLAVTHPASTFLWRLDGVGIPEFHWPPESIVVVDRALEPRLNDIVVAVADEEFVARKVGKARQLLTPCGDPETAQTVQIWGVVTNIIIRYRS